MTGDEQILANHLGDMLPAKLPNKNLISVQVNRPLEFFPPEALPQRPKPWIDEAVPCPWVVLSQGVPGCLEKGFRSTGGAEVEGRPWGVALRQREIQERDRPLVQIDVLGIADDADDLHRLVFLIQDHPGSHRLS